MHTTIQESARAVAARLETAAVLPRGGGERFTGYGVTGVTFASGHVLALRRFVASSIGPAYTSVWHRTPEGRWTFYADVEPRLACARYFGAAGTFAVEDEITLSWSGDASVSVRVRSLGLAWVVHVKHSATTHLFSSVARRLPHAVWRSRHFRSFAAAAAKHALGVGSFALDGSAPCGQRFSLAPQRIWLVDASVARIHGQHLGPLVLPRTQDRLGDFWIPRWSLFMVGHATFESAREPRTTSGGGYGAEAMQDPHGDPDVRWKRRSA
jgi:hypothetical protein